jgi:hypothetical protein
MESFYNLAAPHRAIDFDRLPYLSKAKQRVSFALVMLCFEGYCSYSSAAGLPTTKPPNNNNNTPHSFAHANLGREVRWVGLGWAGLGWVALRVRSFRACVAGWRPAGDLRCLLAEMSARFAARANELATQAKTPQPSKPTTRQKRRSTSSLFRMQAGGRGENHLFFSI